MTRQAPIVLDPETPVEWADAVAVPPPSATPVVLPADAVVTTDALPPSGDESAPSTVAEEEMPPPSPALWPYLLGGCGAVWLLSTLVESARFMGALFAVNGVLGAIGSALVIGVVGVALVMTAKALNELRQLRQISALQRRGEALKTSVHYHQGRAVAREIAALYADRKELQINGFNADRDDAVYLELDRQLAPLDARANTVIARHARETALLIMVSPLSGLDTLLTLWRNAILVREIAAIYRGRPGLLESMSLMSAVAHNLIYAQFSDALADELTDVLGGSVFALVSAKAAQGVGSGLLTVRVGLRAQTLCRPLPFSDRSAPSPTNLRWQMMEALKAVHPKKARS